MLNDPSLEIRYDAVQKVIGQASQSLSSRQPGRRSVVVPTGVGSRPRRKAGG